ncbi:MAG: putative dsRNA-binding protein [Methanoregula sp.]|jgi:ribonuclease-3|nr:putative dsRNA-binding protein [Methanoregula sp.]
MTTVQKLNNDYRRLEFLGDRVLNLIVSDYLYKKFHEYSTGQLTDKLRFTSNDNLKEIVEKLPDEFRTDLFKFKSIFKPDGQTSNADALEAYIGNYFLEHELKETFKYFKKIFADQIDTFNPDTDYVSKLKIHFEQGKELQPVYKLEHTEKRPNNQSVFHFQVSIGGVPRGLGSGSDHAKAQKSAALDALKKLGLEN